MENVGSFQKTARTAKDNSTVALNIYQPAAQRISDDAGEEANKFFAPDSFQNVASLLLIDLSRKNASGERVLELQDIAVYALLKSHSQGGPSCYPSHARLAKLAAVSVSTIQRSLKRLEDAGHIQRKNHNEGKILLLTDVARGSKIVRRERVIVAPQKRETCLPEFQGGIMDARDEIEIFESEFKGESFPEQNLLISEESQMPIDDESPI
jgi:DNA-binding MarR family transcriptional regulator